MYTNTNIHFFIIILAKITIIAAGLQIVTFPGLMRPIKSETTEKLRKIVNALC